MFAKAFLLSLQAAKRRPLQQKQRPPFHGSPGPLPLSYRTGSPTGTVFCSMRATRTAL